MNNDNLRAAFVTAFCGLVQFEYIRLVTNNETMAINSGYACKNVHVYGNFEIAFRIESSGEVMVDRMTGILGELKMFHILNDYVYITRSCLIHGICTVEI